MEITYLNRFKSTLLILISLWAISSTAWASRVVKVQVVDKDYLLVHFMDGEATFVDDGKGSDAYRGHHTSPANSSLVLFGQPLDIASATNSSSWTLVSEEDDNYSAEGKNPDAVHRKSKVNGMAMNEWAGSDWDYDYSKEHFIFLKLPHSLKPNATYTLEIDGSTHSLRSSAEFTFDIFSSRSEAIHTNLVGYLPDSRLKAADLYIYMGDGGTRDYSEFEGNDVYIYNVEAETSEKVGTVRFHQSEQKETQWNLTGSDVWSADFTGFSQPGTYRIAIEGVGCSQDFEISDDIYHDPYKVSVMGYYYMRIGEDKSMTPVPRQPRWIPGEDPSDTRIIKTQMHPYHSNWNSFSSGDAWDNPNDWASYELEGKPENPNAVGGHSDALDWDRHLGHVSNIYDLLLAYIISDGALSDDDLDIKESGNGIPDIIDEARNEVDFWLSLRHGEAYSHGVTNPNDQHILYQAGTTAMAAWANALNSAMLAYACQIAGESDLRARYLDSAEVAFQFADTHEEPMLDEGLNVGQARIRGRDFRMMSAAYLYNLTGNTDYEDIFSEECVVTSPESELFVQNNRNQLWGAVAYLKTEQPVNYAGLRENMRASIIHNARLKETNHTQTRPSRRGYANDGSTAWFQTTSDMPRTLIAHAVTQNESEKAELLDALLLEAGWSLGRNPLNIIQMTTATTALESKRSVENIYTSGRDDGTEGLHPGHTPYLNVEDWGGSMISGNPTKLFAKNYPDWQEWPHAENYISTRYVYAHSEFTPRQSMRFKTLLYGYLYSLASNGVGFESFIAAAGPDQNITDFDGDGKEEVTLDASNSYATGRTITEYKWSAADTLLSTGETTTVELDTGKHVITLSIADEAGETASDVVTISITSKSPNLIDNGDFSAADAGWGNYIHTSMATAAYATDDGVLHASISDGGSETWHIQWYQQNLVIEKGTSYRMVFDAWADAERTLDAEVGMQSSPYDTFLDEIVALTAESKTFELDFTMKRNTHRESRLNFNFGTSDHDVYIDNVELYVTGRDVAIDGGEEDQAGMPGKFRLMENYPNPFNPATTIGYQLPQSANVTIEVYNMLGHRVQTLLNQKKPAGRHQVTFNAGNLASGLYFYTLKAGHYREMKKMLLIK